MLYEDKPPYIIEPAKPETGRPATLIYIHGYGDDAEGLPLGLAQQFQMYHRAEYLRWVLPNAPWDQEAANRSWFKIRPLSHAMLPGKEDEEDDEAGILKSVDALDKLVDEELARGISPDRILVGGFSQGCVISLVWSIVGRNRYKVAGVMPMCGYFPLGHRLEAIRKDRGIEDQAEDRRKWYYVHGSKDLAVSPRLFEQGQKLLATWVSQDKIEARLVEGMGHATNAVVLRGMLRFFDKVVPA